jgi:hypothetical protein
MRSVTYSMRSLFALQIREHFAQLLDQPWQQVGGGRVQNLQVDRSVAVHDAVAQPGGLGPRDLREPRVHRRID